MLGDLCEAKPDTHNHIRYFNSYSSLPNLHGDLQLSHPCHLQATGVSLCCSHRRRCCHVLSLSLMLTCVLTSTLRDLYPHVVLRIYHATASTMLALRHQWQAVLCGKGLRRSHVNSSHALPGYTIWRSKWRSNCAFNQSLILSHTSNGKAERE
jgi:hypothetical protein